jgi:Methyltransferase domain
VSDDDDLLIYSVLEHGQLIFRCLDLVKPRRVLEIGSEVGGFTREMVAWAERAGAHFLAVEPLPVPEIVELAERSSAFELVEGSSPEALAGVEPADVYVVDGDHNYWTVINELRAIYADDRTPLSILHDVGWPCARRDQYYAPERLPEEALRPYSYEGGRVPGQSELAQGGFGGAGEFAVAIEEGGPKNGVLTAVEDFLAERDDLVLARVPAVFGLGIVYSRTAAYAEPLADLLSQWDDNKLLERLERNRIKLYSRVLELQDQQRRVDAGRDRLMARYALRLGELEAENARLRLARARLLEQVDGAAGQSDPLTR